MPVYSQGIIKPIYYIHIYIYLNPKNLGFTNLRHLTLGSIPYTLTVNFSITVCGQKHENRGNGHNIAQKGQKLQKWQKCKNGTKSV
jgi:hypothetical protein